MKIRNTSAVRRLSASAFTLAEVVMSAAVAGVTIGGIIYGYLMASQRAEWSAYSLAGETLAVQRMEQTRSCKYDPLAASPTDQLITNNFASQTNVLDLPISGTNVVWATNFTTITTNASMPYIKCIQVDCVWAWPYNKRLFTNTVITYRGPDS